MNKRLRGARKKLEECDDRYGIGFASIEKPPEGIEKKDSELLPDLSEDERNRIIKDVNLLVRLMTDKEHYLLFLEDYSIPPHNNDAEKCARAIKIHMKPNGGMRSEEYAGYFADTASVLESERRKGKSPFSKLKAVFNRNLGKIKDKMKEAKEKRMAKLKPGEAEPEGC